MSLFQLARYTAIAHDGELMPVTIFKTDPNQPVAGTQVFNPTTAREVRAMLETVVAPGGTSPDAAVPGYRVGGKSGTAYKHEGARLHAQVPRVVRRDGADAESAHRRRGVGRRADRRQPLRRQVSGPVFSAIAGDTMRALNVPPNMPIKQLVVSDDSPAAPSATGAAKAARGWRCEAYDRVQHDA